MRKDKEETGYVVIPGTIEDGLPKEYMDPATTD